MKIFVIILMLIVTVYSINLLVDNGREVKVGESTIKRVKSNLTYVSVTIITLAYIAACVFIYIQLGS